MKKTDKKEVNNNIHLIAWTYAGVAAIWLLLSDYLLYSFFDNIKMLSMVKGAVFILISSLMLYSLVKKYQARIGEHVDTIEGHYQELFSQSSQGIMMIDLEEDKIIDVNPLFAEWLGALPEKMGDKSIENWIKEWKQLKLLIGQDEITEWKINEQSHNFLHLLIQDREFHYQGKKVTILTAVNLNPIKEKEAELQILSRERDRLLYSLDSVQQGILVIDPQYENQNIPYVNRGFCQLMNINKGQIKQRSVLELFDEIAEQKTVKQIEMAIEKRVSISVEFPLLTARQANTWCKLYIEPVFNHKGELINFVFFAVDVTPRKNIERVLNSHNKLLKDLFKSHETDQILSELTTLSEEIFTTSFAAVFYTEKNEQKFVSPSMEKLLGASWKGVLREMYTGVMNIGSNSEAFFVEYVSQSAMPSHIQKLLETIGVETVVSVPIFGKDKEWIGFFKLFFREYKELSKHERRLIMENVHVARISILSNQAEELIYRQAHYDELTNLPNRRTFIDLMEKEITLCKDSDQRCALYYLDIDRFKTINDSFGHYAGNLVLKELGVRLEMICAADNFKLSRLNGDEFAILVRMPEEKADWHEIGKRLMSVLEHPFEISGHSFSIQASLGVAIFPQNGRNPHDLLRNADIAMYLAKEKGKNGMEFYNERLGSRTKRSLLMENQLKRAIKEGAFTLFYQPQYNLNDGKINGFEALIRWHHPTFGLISPAEFIPLAEETGLIVPVGRWVLKEACLQNKKWQDEGKPPVMMSVNISLKQFMQQNFVEMVESVLDETGLDPKYLVLEITESVAMHRPEMTIDAMNRIRSHGIHISIDDFGTGYSSLAHLKDLPVQALKIDKSFIQELTNPNSKAFAITQTTIQLAHNLDLNIVAEGIETEDQMLMLKDYYCQNGQGFLFSPPLPPEEAALMFEQPLKLFKNVKNTIITD